jgi:predicted SprT family Zn-dependent metalloprotease
MPSVSKEEFVKVIGKYFPAEAIDFAWFYFEKHDFSLKVTNARSSKKGDFKYHRDKNKKTTITINGDLCSYDFLIVYIHELAHYMVYHHADIFKAKAHGKEWQFFFKRLLDNVIEQTVLPPDIREAFKYHSLHIKSSTVLDQQLELVLDKYRTKREGMVYLKDLSVGDQFIYRGNLFRIDAFARTRVRCTLAKTNRKYLISSIADVNLT